MKKLRGNGKPDGDSIRGSLVGMPAVNPFQVRPDFSFHSTQTVLFVDGFSGMVTPRHGTQPSWRGIRPEMPETEVISAGTTGGSSGVGSTNSSSAPR